MELVVRHEAGVAGPELAAKAAAWAKALVAGEGKAEAIKKLREVRGALDIAVHFITAELTALEA